MFRITFPTKNSVGAYVYLPSPPIILRGFCDAPIIFLLLLVQETELHTISKHASVKPETPYPDAIRCDTVLCDATNECTVHIYLMGCNTK